MWVDIQIKEWMPWPTLQTLCNNLTLSMTVRREAIIVHYFAPWLPVKVSRQIADSQGDHGTFIVMSASAIKLRDEQRFSQGIEINSVEVANR